MKTISDEELEVFKCWEIDLLKKASFYDGSVEPTEDDDQLGDVRLFDDRLEDWEKNAVDGTGPGPAIPLGVVKKNRAAKFRLQEKYQGLFFTDKDPDGAAGYYETSGANQSPPQPEDKWEHHKIIGLIWENHRGFRLETKLCSSLTGTSSTYFVDPFMIRMIKECTLNSSLRFRSET